MAPTSHQARVSQRRPTPAARRRRFRKADDELFAVVICVAAFLRLRASRKKDPVVRERISWSVHAGTPLQEKEFTQYYRMKYSSFQELLRIVAPYLVVDYYQSMRRSRGTPPLSPAGMLQCALSWLGGGSYHHIRVISPGSVVQLSIASFTV
ncbi:hypothetical protein PHYPSEUDO_012027 [Phytophthora pseudosyringae]|uniref:Uncharacterized protein n=1 Tax=Phytophthora pseudosyringae TaxID=221518 RepID=A0A8T1VAC1_9STRA|nr:hypothetical protein PHYPSEUDO_012027 [Phytophthora pseudosyringae]